MKHVDYTTYQAYHNSNNEELHEAFDPTKGLPASVVELLEACYGTEVAGMCQTERSCVLPHYRDQQRCALFYSTVRPPPRG